MDVVVVARIKERVTEDVKGNFASIFEPPLLAFTEVENWGEEHEKNQDKGGGGGT